MLDVKLLVLFLSFDIVTGTNKYCEICSNHTLCKYTMPGPSSSCKDYHGTRITKDDANNIINKINERRNFVASGLTGLPQAANMNKIYWSEQLALMAQRWVDQCDAATRPDKEDECRDLDDIYVSQAIASVAGPAPGMQLRSMIDLWFMQSLDYKGSVMYYNQSRDWKTNYFTQLIWGETDRVGCGRARFYVDQRGSIVERLVCNFAPGGNMHGKPVYTVGFPATQCQQNKSPDRKFESLCRYFWEDNVADRKSSTVKTAVTSLLRILNLSNKPEADNIRNDLKQVKFDVNETSEQRNQKTRHVLNNSNAVLKNMPPLPMQSYWNSPSNHSRNQRLQRYQQERGHSRVYHGHDNHDQHFASNDRETTNRNYPNHNFQTTRNYLNTDNFRKFNNDFTTQQFNSDRTEDLRKYNRNHECTRNHVQEKNNCEINHQVGVTPCTGCTRDHPDANCLHTTAPCMSDNPCMTKGKYCNICPCNTPSTTCATLAPRCPCNGNCRCFKVDCAANTPCQHFRRSDNNPKKNEDKKQGELNYYDLLPDMVMRSGENENVQSSNKEVYSASPKDEWLQHDSTAEDFHRRLSPRTIHDRKQVKAIFENKRNNKQDYDYIYDSYSRERKRRSPGDDMMTFKPFWQMDEYNRDKSTMLKSIRYTTIPNKKVKKPRRPSSIVIKSHTTESITVQLKDNKEKPNQKIVMTEKYLSFDELMHLRKLTTIETANPIRDEKIHLNNNNDARRSNLNARRIDTTVAAERTGPTSTTYSANTPFMRKKQCTRKLTCTWTAPTIVGADGSVIVPGLGGDRGSKTPPGYVEGCTRTSTCTRDFMDRNKFSTIPDETGSGESTLDDEDYCEKRALDVRKRDSDTKGTTVPSNLHQTHTEAPYTHYISNTYEYIMEDTELSSTTLSTIPTEPLDNCICNNGGVRIKRNEIEPNSDINSLSYGDLFYLVLQKVIDRWKKSQNSNHINTCFCNTAIFVRGSIMLILFMFLYHVLMKYMYM